MAKPAKLGSSPLAGKAGIDEIMRGPVLDVHEVQVAPEVQQVHEEQEARDLLNALGVQDVQGVQEVQKRRRQKYPRINMAFEEDNLEYLRLVSRLDDVSITAYVNGLIGKDREARAHDVIKARRVLK